MISVSHLTRRFGDLTAVDDLSFEIQKGEVVGFLGPNGAGKTTTLRILAGYLPATGGSARVAGFDVLRESAQVRRRIGYLPESVPLYREHRVIEMLEFQARLHEIPRAKARARMEEVLERVGLSERRRDLVGHLSRGLKQRAGLAVALLPDPEVLILDEPTSGLDPIQRIEVRRLVQDLASRHTVILSSHILSEIEATCPRVLILHQGRLVADGTRESLVRRHGRAAHVRLEAVVGPDATAAAQLLRALRGVRDVVDRGRGGIHHQFDVVCDEDLREDVGALAAARRWAVRELSWRAPTLEQIFTSITVGAAVDEAALPATASASPLAPRSAPPIALAPASSSAMASAASASSASAEPASESARTASELPIAGAPAAPGAAPRVVYNLNPFDAGARRDLGKPKAVDGPTPSADAQRAAEARRTSEAGGEPPRGEDRAS